MDFEETKRRLTREIRPGSTKAKTRRSTSEGGKPRDPSKERSRVASSGSSLEVRCACQFFMCDSPLPEKTIQAIASRPSSRLGQDIVNPHGEAHYPSGLTTPLSFGGTSLSGSRNLSPVGGNYTERMYFGGSNSTFAPAIAPMVDADWVAKLR